MGIGGISIWQLLIVLVIVVLLFGTKKLKNIGSDLGGAVKGFKDSMSDEKTAEGEESEEDKQIAQKEAADESSNSATAGQKDKV